jgi:hypothetical protein
MVTGPWSVSPVMFMAASVVAPVVLPRHHDVVERDTVDGPGR